MNTQHTKGEWVKHHKTPSKIMTKSTSTLVDYDCLVCELNSNLDEAKANANLIEAAPKLLQTLTDLLAAYKKAMMLTTGKESNAITVIAEGVIKEATQ